jgi:hypothetical protein
MTKRYVRIALSRFEIMAVELDFIKGERRKHTVLIVRQIKQLRYFLPEQ